MDLPEKAKDIPVTQEMLYDVRNELKHDIASLESKTNSGFKEVQSKLDKVLSIVHRNQTLIEEQNQRNKFVLDGYALMYEEIQKLKQAP